MEKKSTYENITEYLEEYFKLKLKVLNDITECDMLENVPYVNKDGDYEFDDVNKLRSYEDIIEPINKFKIDNKLSEKLLATLNVLSSKNNEGYIKNIIFWLKADITKGAYEGKTISNKQLLSDECYEYCRNKRDFYNKLEGVEYYENSHSDRQKNITDKLLNPDVKTKRLLRNPFSNYREEMLENIDKLGTAINNLKEEWKELTGLVYPQMFGETGIIKMSDYTMKFYKTESMFFLEGGALKSYVSKEKIENLFIKPEQHQKAVSSEKTIGVVSWANGEIKEYQNADLFIEVVKEELPYRSTSGFRFVDISSDPKLYKALDNLIYNEYGENNPHPMSHYEEYAAINAQMNNLGYERIYMAGFSEDFLMWKEISTGKEFGLDGWEGVTEFLSNKLSEKTNIEKKETFTPRQFVDRLQLQKELQDKGIQMQ